MSNVELIGDVEKNVIEELTNPPASMPLRWWPRFNALFGGLRLHELTVLSAPTGSGKTTFTANLVCQTLEESRGSYICSAEIGNTMFLLAMYSAFEKRGLGRGDRLDSKEVEALVRKYRPVMRGAHLVFSKYDDRIEPRQLIAEIERAHRDFGIKFVILDNLQFFMPIVSSTNQLAVTDGAIRDFTRFIRKTPVHCVLIAHPKKTPDNRIQDEGSVKGSSTIYQECSNFIGLNRLSENTLNQPGFTKNDRMLTIFKLRRRGENVGEHVFFEYHGGRYIEKELQEFKP